MYRSILLAAVCATAASAQAQRREPAVNDTLQSPEVSSDHHVTFRIFAPKASEVTLTGDWLGATPAPKLSKDETRRLERHPRPVRAEYLHLFL